jgi:hypothetical protein
MPLPEVGGHEAVDEEVGAGVDFMNQFRPYVIYG